MSHRISVVVPNFNGGQFLAECLQSIVDQDWPDKEIIVIDGGSHDYSNAILRSFDEHLTHWESAPDGGQYHAIERGLNLATGDVLCWLNSDDCFFPGAFREVMESFQKHPEQQWLSGAHSTFLAPRYAAQRGMKRESYFHSSDHEYVVKITRTSQTENWSWDYLLEQSPNSGYYLQQESTFWSNRLWRDVGGFDHTYRWACDYWLWLQYLDRTPLTIIDRPLGCFRQWSGQCTANRLEEYIAEVYDIARRWKARDTRRQRIVAAETAHGLPNAGKVQTEHRRIRKVTGAARDKLCLATSLAPRNTNWQARCLSTWFRQGIRVVSLNTPAEIETLATCGEKAFEKVEFHPIRETAREITGIDLPLVREFVRFAQAEDRRSYVGFINSDIRVDDNIDLLGMVREGCSASSCIVSSRLDYDGTPWSPGSSPNQYGYDVFIFQAGTLDDYPLTTDYAVGAPWWDYFMANYCLERFETVYRCDPIPFYHRNHVAQYSLDLWLRYGHQFLSWVQPDSDFGDPDPVRNGAGIARNNEVFNQAAIQFTREFQRRTQTLAPLSWALRTPPAAPNSAGTRRANVCNPAGRGDSGSGDIRMPARPLEPRHPEFTLRKAG